jgi:hypothetical protein
MVNSFLLFVIPAEAGIHCLLLSWIPAYAGMTTLSYFDFYRSGGRFYVLSLLRPGPRHKQRFPLLYR